MQTEWRETANAGRLLYISVEGRHLAHIPGEEKAEAISLWEGFRGLAPAGRFAYWRWRRGLQRLTKDLEKAVQPIAEPVT